MGKNVIVAKCPHCKNTEVNLIDYIEYGDVGGVKCGHWWFP